MRVIRLFFAWLCCWRKATLLSAPELSYVQQSNKTKPRLSRREESYACDTLRSAWPVIVKLRVSQVGKENTVCRRHVLTESMLSHINVSAGYVFRQFQAVPSLFLPNISENACCTTSDNSRAGSRRCWCTTRRTKSVHWLVRGASPPGHEVWLQKHIEIRHLRSTSCTLLPQARA